MVADIQLDDLGDLGNGKDILVVKTVACMHFEARRPGEPRGVDDAPKLSRLCGPIACGRGAAIGAGVELDRVGADRARGFDLSGIGVDEESDLDAGVAQRADEGL